MKDDVSLVGLWAVPDFSTADAYVGGTLKVDGKRVGEAIEFTQVKGQACFRVQFDSEEALAKYMKGGHITLGVYKEVDSE